MAATPQPFVVCVRGNTNDTSRTKALLTPPMSPAAVDALTKRVWSKLHGAAAAVPGEVDWAYENEAAISLLNPSDVTLLHTLSAQYLQARETYLTIRVKARHEAWQAIPKAVARDGRRNGKRRVIDSQPVGSMASGEELDIRTTSYMQAMEASDRSKPATRAQDKPSSPPSSSSSSSTSAEMSDCLWWLREDHPAARFLEIATMIVIVLSIINLVVQTIPQHRLNDDGTDKPEDRGSSFFIIESFCIAWFTIEFAMRLYATDDRRGFWLKPLNIVDIIAIVPYYISLGADGSAASSLAILRVLRLSRVLRMFKLSRHNEGLRTMIKCMALSGKELSLFLMVVTVAVILFASAMFYIEKDEDDTLFTSIPASMWWAVITLTTVGYGDIFPTTVPGASLVQFVPAWASFCWPFWLASSLASL
jgi:hypothetical protein